MRNSYPHVVPPMPDDCAHEHLKKEVVIIQKDKQYNNSWVAPAKGGMKFDGDKPRMDLIDRAAMEELAHVLGFGAKKYAAHNWRKGINYSRLVGAALRHIHAFNDGEDKDPESGYSHIGHAMCCLMFLMGTIKHNPDMDDRWNKDNE
jgi:hypothetical protein